jgi:hypothetical protein
MEYQQVKCIISMKARIQMLSGYKVINQQHHLATPEQSVVTLVPSNSTGTLVSDYITPELGFSVIPGGTQRFHLHFLKDKSK